MARYTLVYLITISAHYCKPQFKRSLNIVYWIFMRCWWVCWILRIFLQDLKTKLSWFGIRCVYIAFIYVCFLHFADIFCTKSKIGLAFVMSNGLLCSKGRRVRVQSWARVATQILKACNLKANMRWGSKGMTGALVIQAWDVTQDK